MSVKKRFIWSDKEYSLREFVSEFIYSLPLVVRVCRGYCSHDGYTYTFGSDEEYRISQIKGQRRVVVSDTLGRRLSIPEEYPIRFFQLRQGKATSSSPVLLQELMDNLSPGMVIQPERRFRLQFWIGADKTMKTDVQTLEIVEIYIDRYLVGNPVHEGLLNQRAVVIPLFVSIKLALAEGLLNGTTEDFQKVLSDLDTMATKCRTDVISGNPEIMLYDEEHNISNSEYAYIEPKTYISCAQATLVRSDVSQGKHHLTSNPVYGQPTRVPPPVSAKPRPNARQNKPLPPLPDEVQGTDQKPKPLEKVLPMPATQMGNITDQIKNVRLKPISGQTLSGYSSASKTRPHSCATKWPDPMGKERDSNVYMDVPPDYPIESKPYMTLRKDSAEEKRDDDYSSGYAKLGDVPMNFQSVSIKGTVEILRLLHLGKYVDTFVENDIDGGLLSSLNTDIMRNDLAMTQFDATKLHKFVHEGWRPKAQ